LAIDRETRSFPSDEKFGLTSQLRRASVSIPSNIAEGCGRAGDPELAKFLQIAMGSASEVECQLLIAKELGYLKFESHGPLEKAVQEVKRMLSAFILRLHSPPSFSAFILRLRNDNKKS